MAFSARLLTLLLSVLCYVSAHAATIEQPLADPAQEAKARTIFHELKCVVCEGQSLAESDATLAAQMRARIRAMVADGKSETEIIAFFRHAYGERILMAPPMEPTTVLLWLTPLILLIAGVILLRRTTRTGDSA